MNELETAKRQAREAAADVKAAKEELARAPAGPRILSSQYEAAKRQGKRALIAEWNQQAAEADRPRQALEAAEERLEQAEQRIDDVWKRVEEQRQAVDRYYKRTAPGGNYDDLLMKEWDPDRVAVHRQGRADERGNLSAANERLERLCGHTWDPVAQRWQKA